MIIMKSENFKDILRAGDIFCIPLFIDLNEKPTKSYTRVKFPEDQQYAFGRFIEDQAGGGILIEVFEKTNNLKNLSLEEITKSGRLFPQVKTSGIEFVKKRWRVLASDEHYDKYRDSDYDEIRFVLSPYDEPKLWSLKDNSEKGISELEVKNYEISRIWFPNQLEKRIIEALFEN